MNNAALYVDGFNFYHAVNELGENFLKWCNLWRLGELLVPSRDEKLVKVVYCTAFYPGDERKRWRHEQYIKALMLKNVSSIMGHYVHEPRKCNSCERTWRHPTEKETDINVALALMNDAHANVFETAYLLTADSDQAANACSFKQLFPGKKIITVAPPGRNFSSHIQKYCDGRIALNRDHLDKCVMKALEDDGRTAIRRPREYDPPHEWIHPERRPD